MRWILLLLMGFSCTQSPNTLDSWMQADDKLKVLSTTAIIGSMVSEIGGDHIHHISLIQGEIDPHNYELVKGDDEKLSRANLIFYNGLGLEHGASLRHRLDCHPAAIGLGNLIYQNDPQLILHKESQVDPHIWMDVAMWSRVIDPIIKNLSHYSPEHSKDFENNGNKLKIKLAQLHDQIQTKLSSIDSNKKFLVTSHDAFNYFAHQYLNIDGQWQSRCQAPEGLAPDGQLSCFDLQQIIDHLWQHKIKVVFSESNVSRDSLNKIIFACREKGLKVRIAKHTLYADALGMPFSDADTYEKMMIHNIDALISEWSQDEF